MIHDVILQMKTQRVLAQKSQMQYDNELIVEVY